MERTFFIDFERAEKAPPFIIPVQDWHYGLWESITKDCSTHEDIWWTLGAQYISFTSCSESNIIRIPRFKLNELCRRMLTSHLHEVEDPKL